MDVLHHQLEAVKEFCLCILYLAHEVLGEIFIHDPVRGCKEGQNMLDEIPFVVIELVLPVINILFQVYLFGSPEAGLLLFVPLPDVFVLNGKNDKPVFVT